MESLGDKLRTAREKKAATFDQITRDTNIARRYLEALEAEDFSQFPGEPYLLGFLRNYADYLGLDSQELISLYKTIKIQEQPIPVEQLLTDTKKGPGVPIVLGAGAGIVLVAVVVLYGFFGRPSGSARQDEKPRTAAVYALASGTLEKRLYPGDSALLQLGADQYKLELLELDVSVTLGTPVGNLVLALGQESAVDLNGDGKADLKLFVADFFKNEPTKGVALRLELTDSILPMTQTAATVDAPEIISTNQTASASASPSTPMAVSAVAVAVAVAAPVIFSSPNAYPFTLQATFKAYCMFRWESDRKERDERYFHKAEVLNVQAQNGIRLWVSNASAVKLQVIGGGRTVDLEIGGPGEVVVVDLKWVRDEDGRFKLTTVRLD